MKGENMFIQIGKKVINTDHIIDMYFGTVVTITTTELDGDYHYVYELNEEESAAFLEWWLSCSNVYKIC